MSDELWWTDRDTHLGQIENEDTHVTNLHGRRVDGVWEYAAVRWRYQSPYLMWTLREGKLVQP